MSKNLRASEEQELEEAGILQKLDPAQLGAEVEGGFELLPPVAEYETKLPDGEYSCLLKNRSIL